MGQLASQRATRREFLGLSLRLAFTTLLSGCKSKGRYDISNFREIEEIKELFEDRDLQKASHSALFDVITLQQNPENNSDENFQLATLWLLKSMLDNRSIKFKEAQEKPLIENLAKSTKIKLTRIDDNYSPLSYAIYNYLKMPNIKGTLDRRLQSTIPLIGDNHRHLPVVSADRLSKVLISALGVKNVTDAYAKFMYATLFMICALEVGDSCNQPALCGYKHGQYSRLNLYFRSSQPETNGSSAFGMYQIIKKTFQRMSKNIKKGGGIDLDYRNPAHQLMAASRLIHEKLDEYLKSKDSDLKDFVNSIITTGGLNQLESLAEFLTTIDHPVWAALSRPFSKTPCLYGTITTTVRGSLFLRGLELASTMQKAR